MYVRYIVEWYPKLKCGSANILFMIGPFPSCRSCARYIIRVKDDKNKIEVRAIGRGDFFLNSFSDNRTSVVLIKIDIIAVMKKVEPIAIASLLSVFSIDITVSVHIQSENSREKNVAHDMKNMIAMFSIIFIGLYGICAMRLINSITEMILITKGILNTNPLGLKAIYSRKRKYVIENL